jgi:hypothetical protein
VGPGELHICSVLHKATGTVLYIGTLFSGSFIHEIKNLQVETLICAYGERCLAGDASVTSPNWSNGTRYIHFLGSTPSQIKIRPHGVWNGGLRQPYLSLLVSSIHI